MARKILLVANTDWYLHHFRQDLIAELRRRGWDICLASPPGEYAPKLLEAGYAWTALPFDRKGGNPTHEMALIWRLIQLYRREQPDLCVHFTIKPALYGTLAARWVGIPGVVNTVTGLGTLYLARGLWPQVRRALVVPIYRMAMRSPRVWLIFEHAVDRAFYLQSGLVSPERTVIIPGAGVDTHRFNPSAEPQGRIVAMMVSRMMWDKGAGEFVEAARLLRSWGENLRMVLVGEPDPGNPTSVPVELLEGWAEEGIVEWWGKREDMPAVLAQANMVVLPSYGEGIPTVLLEAAAAGRAIVASDIPGCREIVRDRESGVLVPVGDAEALAMAIRSLAGDAELRASLSTHARRLVEARFSHETISESTIAAYEQALEQAAKKKDDRGAA